MLPVTRSLVNNLNLNTRVMTPNGDGVNDELVVNLDLVNVLVPRPLRFAVTDLSGRRAHEVEAQAVAGRTSFSWDGRSTGGPLVPPGIYLVEVTIVGDTGDRTTRQVVAVAY